MEELFKKRKEQLDLFKAFRKKETVTKKSEAPEGLYQQCPGCGVSLPSKELKANLYICPKCGSYLRMYAYTRLELIADGGEYKELFRGMKTKNPLKFPGYVKKVTALKQATGLDEAVVCATLSIGGNKAVVCVMDSRFLMGSMGSVVGEKVTKSIEYATKKRLPLVIFTASGGARMQEGIVSLMQMAKTSAALAKHSEGGQLFISYLTHPTTGGVTASFAMLGDVILAEPKALIGFAGPRVIAQTIGQELPEGFQRSEFLIEKGFVDEIVPRETMAEQLGLLLRLHKKEGKA